MCVCRVPTQHHNENRRRLMLILEHREYLKQYVIESKLITVVVGNKHAIKHALIQYSVKMLNK